MKKQSLVLNNTEVAEGYIGLVKKPESNVLGQGGFAVLVDLQGIVTKDLNFKTFDEAQGVYERELYAYWDGSLVQEAREKLKRI